ncbi:MAG: oligosaccharide flippase family protein, partial [Bacteroidales bacterium]|nr:oligosaccharide flippase family protein [Bacteroidales bacterium]
MEIKHIVKNVFYLGSTKFFELIIQVIRAKLNAVFIGVSGIGVYNQLNVFAAKTAQFSQLSVNEALVKQIAENKDNESTFNRIFASIKAYILIVLSITVLVLTALFIFRQQISSYVLGNEITIKFYLIAISAMPLIFINTVFFAILRGFKSVKNISRARLFASFFNLLIFVPLILGYGLNGVIISIPLMYIVISGWNFFFLKKHILKPLEVTYKKVFRAKIRKDSINEMFVFSGYGLSVGFLSIISEFVIRGLIVENLGIEKIGIYAPIISWAGIFTGVVISSFSTYLFPRLCETKNISETNDVINSSIRVSTFLLIPFILLFITFRKELILIFYTKDFLETTQYLPLHFLGVIWHVWFVVLGQTMAPKGFIKQHGIFRGISYVFDILIVYYFISFWGFGLYGWMLKFLITPFLLFIIYYFFLNIKMELRINKEN